tara:strand:+ start:176 stop:715 length:540 start_codon:yes stop_codon:yes gene_type:complete
MTNYQPFLLDDMLKRTIGWTKTNKIKAMSLVLILSLLASVAGYAYYQTFKAIELNVELSEGAQYYKSGVCVDGEVHHTCEGNISVMEENGSYFLYFEDYDATDGPDVWFYMTVEGNEEDTEKVEDEGLLIVTPQTEDGRAEVEGTFSIPLPEDYDPDAWAGLTVWCEQYSLSMGSVALS